MSEFSVDYRNTKITSMHLYPRRLNVAAQVAEKLKRVTYAYPSYGGTQKKEKKKESRVVTRMQCWDIQS